MICYRVPKKKKSHKVAKPQNSYEGPLFIESLALSELFVWLKTS